MRLIIGKRKIYVLLLGVVLFITAAIPRSIELLNHNYLWGFDQGEHYLAAWDIARNANFTLIGTKVGGAGGFFQGPGWYYLLAFCILIGNGDPYTGMIMMFAFGLGSVILAFYFIGKRYGYICGFMTALLIAISAEIIPQSRFIWPPFPVTFLTVVFLYFFYMALYGKGKYLYLASFIVGLMAHFEIATSGTLIILFYIFGILLIYKRVITVKTYLISFIFFILPLSPLILFDIRHNFLVTRGVLAMFLGHQDIQAQIPDLFSNHFNVFYGNLERTFYYFRITKYLYVLIALAGGYLIFKKSPDKAQRYFFLFLITSPLILFAIFLLYKQGMWSWWILPLPVIYCYIMGISLYKIWEIKQLRIFIIMFLVFLFGSYAVQTFNWFKYDFYDYGGTHKIKGKTDALDFIYKDAGGEKFGLMVFTPPIYTYAYDYILKWYGEKQYKYIPPNEKSDIFYTLIEPDPEKPWRHKGWLETVVKNGKIIKAVNPNSGFIIQKRSLK